MPIIKKLTAAVVLSAALASCASVSREVYSISYDVFDVPGITVLDYQYTKGPKVIFGVEDSIKYSPSFNGLFGFRARGSYELGDKLFVKWKINETQEIKSDTVDLSKILPSRLEDKNLVFIIDNDKLNIYVSGPDVKDATRCKLLWAEYRQHKTADSAAKRRHCFSHLVKIYPEVKVMLD